MLRAIALMAGVLLPSAGPFAEEKPAGPLERMDEAIINVGAQIRNSEMRLNRGFSGLRPQGDPAQAEYQTIATECCLANLETIKEQVLSVQGSMGELRRYYSARQNRTALGLLDQMDTRLRQLADATMSFIRAPDKGKALNALRGAIRPWNEFRNGIEALQGCCPLVDIVDAPGVQLAPTPPVEPFAGRGSDD